MSLPEYSLKNRKVVGFFLFILLAGGALGFVTLGKKEDSVFVIKSASLVCSYPGATPLEVEQLVTEPIEREVQSMRRVHKITSESYYGLSKIQVELDPATPAAEIPQLWDELRRKVLNVQPRLPAGASAVTVADDFGDVYGIYYGLSVDGGFTWSELRDWAQRLKTALVTVDGVQKVALYGEQTPVVNVYVSMATLANFAIRPETIVATIGQQNSIVDSGEKQAGKLQIQILEDGTYKTLDDLSDQLLISSSGKQYRLGDIARVERGYAEPPQTMMRVDGRRAVGIGVSTEEGVDVVKTGAEIESLLASLTRQMPLGMELTVLYPENRIAREANSTFILNLAESVAIVILIIMLVMGFRAGVLIGSSLLFSIGGTLLLMQFLGEGLNRTSLAGFIIAMGMLVDNAIVVTDNAQQAMLRGVARRSAVVDGANAPRWSLLGATLIAIFSFLPLYLAPSSVAEIVKPLFVVLALSLLLSWVLALTQTPLFGDFMLRVNPAAHDPYDTKFYRAFDRLLAALLRWRWGVVAGVVALFAAALAVMGLMPQNFFPSLDKPYFRADVLLPEGYGAGERAKFEAACREFAREFFSYSPFREYASRFNIRAVWAPSADSGVTIPGERVWRNTACGASFYTFGSERYQMVDDFQRLRDIAAHVPYDYIYVLSNTQKYGGGGIFNFYGISAAHHPTRTGKIYVHEFGHLLLGLGDEYVGTTSYDDMYARDIEPWEANLTTLVGFEDKFWKAMVPAGTPVPTPDTPEYEGVVGVFEGGGYAAKGVYRPWRNCLMNNLHRTDEFCPVCTKAICDYIEFLCR